MYRTCLSCVRVLTSQLKYKINPLISDESLIALVTPISVRLYATVVKQKKASTKCRKYVVLSVECINYNNMIYI